MSASGRRVASRRNTVKEGSMVLVGGGFGLLWRLASLERRRWQVWGVWVCVSFVLMWALSESFYLFAWTLSASDDSVVLWKDEGYVKPLL